MFTRKRSLADLHEELVLTRSVSDSLATTFVDRDSETNQDMVYGFNKIEKDRWKLVSCPIETGRPLN